MTEWIEKLAPGSVRGLDKWKCIPKNGRNKTSDVVIVIRELAGVVV